MLCKVYMYIHIWWIKTYVCIVRVYLLHPILVLPIRKKYSIRTIILGRMQIKCTWKIPATTSQFISHMPIISQWLHIDTISIFDVSLWIKSHVWVKSKLSRFRFCWWNVQIFSQSQNPSKSPNLIFLNFLVDPVWVPWFLIDFPHRFSRFLGAQGAHGDPLATCLDGG